MKELNEYTMEVRRRVEEKKRARRRTAGRIAALSAPLALLFTLTAFLLPRFLPAPDTAPEDTDCPPVSDSIEQASPDGSPLTVTVAALEESEDESFLQITADAAYELKALIDGILRDGAVAEDFSTLPESHDLCRRITLIDGNGHESSFELTGSSLKDEETGVVYAIPQEKYERFLSLFSE